MSDVTESVAFRRRLRLWLFGAGWLVLIVALVTWYIVHEQSVRQEERVVARFVLCRELETIKAAQRADLREQIQSSRDFLEQNPTGIPGISGDIIQQGINRDERLLKRLRPYPKGCAAFARQPTNLDVKVPAVPS